VKYLLNIGNTHTVLAQFDPINGIKLLQSFYTENFTASDLPDGDVAAISVVPKVKKLLQDKGVFFLDSTNSCGSVDFTCVDCSTLGADRVANAEALAAYYPLPGIVIDCGTAITMEVVDADKIFRGGAIAPGRSLMRRSLKAGTAQLPDIPLSRNIPLDIGVGTQGNITFGIDCGCIGMVKEFIRVAKENYGIRSIVLAGGDAKFFRPALPEAVMASLDFTFQGVRIGSGW
jgi:type III pantothenate kinase